MVAGHHKQKHAQQGPLAQDEVASSVTRSRRPQHFAASCVDNSIFLSAVEDTHKRSAASTWSDSVVRSRALFAPNTMQDTLPCKACRHVHATVMAVDAWLSLVAFRHRPLAQPGTRRDCPLYKSPISSKLSPPAYDEWGHTCAAKMWPRAAASPVYCRRMSAVAYEGFNVARAGEES